MWCTECGTETENKAKFCFNCGSKINTLSGSNNNNNNYSYENTLNNNQIINNMQGQQTFGMDGKIQNQQMLGTNNNIYNQQAFGRNDNSQEQQGIKTNNSIQGQYTFGVNDSIQTQQMFVGNQNTYGQQVFGGNNNMQEQCMSGMNNDLEYSLNMNKRTDYNMGVQSKFTMVNKNYTQAELIHIINTQVVIEPVDIKEKLYLNVHFEKNRHKFKSAMNEYFLQDIEPEIPCILYDDTAFGSAKNGFIITNKAIHWKNYLGYPGRIALSNITSIRAKKGVLLINEEEISISLVGKHYFEMERIIMRIIELLS